jgi:hypothetical protein
MRWPGEADEKGRHLDQASNSCLAPCDEAAGERVPVEQTYRDCFVSVTWQGMGSCERYDEGRNQIQSDALSALVGVQ